MHYMHVKIFDVFMPSMMLAKMSSSHFALKYDSSVPNPTEHADTQTMRCRTGTSP
jgi:hypothetical protein